MESVPPAAKNLFLETSSRCSGQIRLRRSLRKVLGTPKKTIDTFFCVSSRCLTGGYCLLASPRSEQLARRANFTLWYNLYQFLIKTLNRMPFSEQPSGQGPTVNAEIRPLASKSKHTIKFPVQTFLGIQNPFFKKGFGRRRHALYSTFCLRISIGACSLGVYAPLL